MTDNVSPFKATHKNFVEKLQLIQLYKKFEQVIAISLSIIFAIVIIISLIQLVRAVYVMLFLDALNPLNHEIFQTVFGMIMTLLIAMEFKHSIIRVALREDSIIKVKTVFLIAIIALSRKFVILEAGATPSKIAALACAVVALGIVYWLMREKMSSSSNV